ncbi:hypothetical protein Q2T83_14815 [Fervidibacter sacchari]|uniref:Uncharacterized protein n=1 Tax=Candidatus Fervidibacter sacchari TaxID=1448929 RepID=A0ABT2EJA1_9BACT|nr:hypothetical protein [Candidatus Fervidibacter sacchari]MCS3917769.1 hypothetical protein [Candidatus Fervidibacter sacchari]WKU15592.1 hypothetical protein Q2T83_14815 [Candidatus Fervidibacter sacchari]
MFSLKGSAPTLTKMVLHFAPHTQIWAHREVRLPEQFQDWEGEASAEPKQLSG